ncbi:MAG TPA: tRNA epoxyqueuosine(34) reductase QueG [Candidatus Binatia bacterium]|nr:tRNA epoxyqueuosine(34) reductase QueG [Candidatus Binatia bacterium]
MAGREERITAAAQVLGFPLAGCVPIVPLPRDEYLAAWIADGRAGEMTYLTTRSAERLDPRRTYPWARSVITLAWPYRPPPPPPVDWRTTLRGRIAAYTVGIDYHDRLRTTLRTLIDALHVHFPEATFRPYVDTGPLLEREWAMRAGQGWIGKNTLLLHRSHGSYFFLAELLTSLELDDVPLPSDHCGTCTRCLTGCPTGALGPYTMDPRLCISYLTIEHRSAIPTALRPKIDNWVFGCDVCQEVCPWNGDERDDEAAAFLHPSLPELMTLDVHNYRLRFGRTAVTRTRRRGLLRNTAVALGNSGNPEAIPSLLKAFEDREPLIRAHVAWALGRLGGTTARSALANARSTEPDAAVIAEIVAALGG